MVGDYISREAAMSFPFANDQYDHVHADPHFIAGCETYKEWLRTIPAADEAPVRHGRWERVGNYDKWICSRCKSENLYAYSYGDDDYELQDFFCPHCGANMDGSDKNA